MKIAEKIISIRGQHFVLTNQRALFWKEASTLVLSDLHLGKTAHFRKNGIALPSGIIQQDLKRLSHLIHHFETEKIIIVGDFLHAGKNSEFEIFKDWIKDFPGLILILVKGNHDRISDEVLVELGISDVCTVYMEKDFIFSHQNVMNENDFVISGHVHPGVVLKLATKNLKFPCYVVTESHLVLPAFSTFTGLDTKEHFAHAKKYIFDQESVFLID